LRAESHGCAKVAAGRDSQPRVRLGACQECAGARDISATPGELGRLGAECATIPGRMAVGVGVVAGDLIVRLGADARIEAPSLLGARTFDNA
jgi:hypothetical protein